MQNGQDSAIGLAPLQFPDEQVLEKISYRLKLAAGSAVGRYMVTTLKQADQIAFDYWHDYVPHLPAWEACQRMLEDAVFPSQFDPRTVGEMLSTWLSIAIRLGVTWPGMTREQIEETSEHRRLLNEAIELIEPSARTFDRIGRNIARAIESFGVCLDDVKNSQAHDELTIVMGLLDSLCRDGINTHEDVVGVIQNFIVSHLGRLSIHESASVDTVSLQMQLQESLATNRRLTDDLNAARSLLSTQDTWKQQGNDAQEMIAQLEESVENLEAQLAKMREQSVASVHDADLRNLHEDHLSILKELAFLRAQRVRITQEMDSAQMDHRIALERGLHNTMNRRLDAVINTAKRIQEVGDTIAHLEKVRQAIEKKMEDRTLELQSELLGEIYFDAQRPVGARPVADVLSNNAATGAKRSLEQRVNENVDLFVSAKFRATFDELIKTKAVRSLWAFLEEMPRRSAFRKEVKRHHGHIWLPNFDGLCARLLRLGLWSHDKSAIDHAKVDALLTTQGF